MWLVTTTGFFSIVEKPSDRAAGTLTVRVRARGDLDSFRSAYCPTLGPTFEDLRADYRYRAHATREDVAAALARAAGRIDYENFKKAVAEQQGLARSHLYEMIWATLRNAQPLK